MPTTVMWEHRPVRNRCAQHRRQRTGKSFLAELPLAKIRIAVPVEVLVFEHVSHPYLVRIEKTGHPQPGRLAHTGSSRDPMLHLMKCTRLSMPALKVVLPSLADAGHAEVHPEADAAAAPDERDPAQGNYKESSASFRPQSEGGRSRFPRRALRAHGLAVAAFRYSQCGVWRESGRIWKNLQKPSIPGAFPSILGGANGSREAIILPMR